MINLVLTENQAKNLVAVMYSGMAAETLRQLGLHEVMEPMIRGVGRYHFDSDPTSILWMPSKARVIRKDDPPVDPDYVTIDCT
jgi:hypothetical protein